MAQALTVEEGGSDFVFPPVLSDSNTSDVTRQPLRILCHRFPPQLQVFNSILSNHGPLGDKTGGRAVSDGQICSDTHTIQCI